MLKKQIGKKGVVGLIAATLLAVFFTFQNFSYYNANYSERRQANLLVTTLYSSLLGRAADSGGLNYWVYQLIGGASPVSVVESFAIASDEFVNRYAGYPNKDFIATMYYIFFHRNPDSGGGAYWLGELNKGFPRKAFIQTLIRSPEFNLANFMNYTNPVSSWQAPTVGAITISAVSITSTSNTFFLQPYIKNLTMVPLKGWTSIMCDVWDVAGATFMKNNGTVLNLEMMPNENANFTTHNNGAVLPKKGKMYKGACTLATGSTVFSKFEFSFVAN